MLLKREIGTVHNANAMRILVVDDDPMTLKAVTKNLKKEGYEVRTASGGMAALQIIENENLDLIITDIMMPELSGLNLISFFREFYSVKVPIIIISSLENNNYPSLQEGANDFLIKPINFVELSSTVRKH